MDIKDVLVSAAEFSIRGTNIELETEIAEDLLPVRADEHQINQVISNLVINAQQAMPEGGKVRLKAENEDGKRIRITVSDEGVGIPLEIQEKIFDPYFTTKGTGSGLGLASCYSIIRKHGGTIEAKSEKGCGATFTVRLPASEVSQAGETGFKREKPLDPAKPTGRILVVDDIPSIRKLTRDALATGGFAAEEACNLEEARNQYLAAMEGKSPFDLVITDLTIPGSPGGEEIAKVILELDPNARLIVSSGYADAPVIANFEEYGFVGRIVKPYSAKELLKMVRSILQDQNP